MTKEDRTKIRTVLFVIPIKPAVKALVKDVTMRVVINKRDAKLINATGKLQRKARKIIGL